MHYKTSWWLGTGRSGAKEPSSLPERCFRKCKRAQDGGKPSFGCLVAGWGGAGQLSSLLQKSLTLQPGGSAVPDGSQPAGAAGAGVLPHCSSSAASGSMPAPDGAPACCNPSARQPATRHASSQSPESLQERLAKAQSLLGNAGLVAKLPDGGARLRGQVAELQRQLNGSAGEHSQAKA